MPTADNDRQASNHTIFEHIAHHHVIGEIAGGFERLGRTARL
jgi:hypothetical protein